MIVASSVVLPTVAAEHRERAPAQVERNSFEHDISPTRRTRRHKTLIAGALLIGS